MRIDEYWRATTQLKSEAEIYKVRSTANIYTLKISEQYKQKLLTEWLREKLYVYDRSTRTYRLPPAAGMARWPKPTIGFNLKSEDLLDRQKKVVNQIRHDKPRSCMIVAWTWCGKSYIIAWIIALTKWRTIIVVPSIAIANWLLEKLSTYSNSVFFAQWKEVAETDADIVICHHQTFNKYYDQINWKFDVLIQDEQHHLSKKRMEQYCKWKWWLIYWTTATPIRKEFDSKWFRLFYWKLYETWVQALPIKVYRYIYTHDYNWDDVDKASEWLAPDSNEIFRRLIINNNDRYNKLVDLLKRLDLMWYKKYIIFSDRVNHIEKTLDILNANWYNAIWYYWATKKSEAEAIIKSLDKFVIVWHPASCWEWFDIPSIEVSILFTSTWREWIVQQMAWRARRYSGEKKEWILVDFADKLSIMWGKQKTLSLSERMKIYRKSWWDVIDLNTNK